MFYDIQILLNDRIADVTVIDMVPECFCEPGKQAYLLSFMDGGDMNVCVLLRDQEGGWSAKEIVPLVPERFKHTYVHYFTPDMDSEGLRFIGDRIDQAVMAKFRQQFGEAHLN